MQKANPFSNLKKRTLVATAIRHFDGLRYDLLAYAIMDDHVHALVLLLADYSLQQILRSWKSFTANELRRLQQRVVPVWQNESFDRIVRDETELIQKMEYILGNPAKRWPDIEEYPWVGWRSWNS